METLIRPKKKPSKGIPIPGWQDDLGPNIVFRASDYPIPNDNTLCEPVCYTSSHRIRYGHGHNYLTN